MIADYTYESYSGNAYVLYEKDGKLYEVHGSHCSCYGSDLSKSDATDAVDFFIRNYTLKRK